MTTPLRASGREPEPGTPRTATGRDAGAPLPPGVVGAAILDGRAAAVSGQYDEWSFEAGHPNAYLDRLRYQGDQAVHLHQSATESGVREIRRRHRQAAARQQAEAEHAREAVAIARENRDRARHREEVTLEGLDLLVGGSPPPVGPDWGDDEAEAVVEATPDAAGEDDPDGLEDLDDRQDLDDEETSSAVSAGRPSRLRWMGPADGGLTIPLHPYVKYGALLLLCLVEIPIYERIFAFFHPHDMVLRWSFTLPVAIGMILAPHVAGIMFRNRHASPVERAVIWVVAVLMLLWAAAACLLGWLRQAALLAPRIDEETGRSVGGLEALNLSWWTMTSVFAIILLVSGLVAFMLGSADHHPGVRALRESAQHRERAEEAYLEAVRAHAVLGQGTVEVEEEEMTSFRAERDRREEALRDEYAAANPAYLDAVAMTRGNPAVTQAVNARLNREDELAG